MKDLVSIIIPTYKRPFSVLKKALDSALSQTYSNIEVIIIDDNPSDENFRNQISAKINELNDLRIRYIQHKVNLGACAARNTGIEHSKGDFISFLDDDDEWIKNKLELQMKKFTDEKIGLVYCDSYTITMIKNIEIERKVRSYHITGMVFDELIKNNFVGSTSFPLIRSEAIRVCGRFNPTMQSAQDYELWLRISKAYKIDCVNKPLVKYYNHDGERISTNYRAKIQGQEQIIEIYLPYLKENPKVYGLKKSKILPFFYEEYGFRKSLVFSWETFKIYPFNKRLFKNFLKIILKKTKSFFYQK